MRLPDSDAEMATSMLECRIDMNQMGGIELVINLTAARTLGLDVPAMSRRRGGRIGLAVHASDPERSYPDTAASISTECGEGPTLYAR